MAIVNEEIKAKIEQHGLWIQSNGEEGAPNLNFSPSPQYVNLSQAKIMTTAPIATNITIDRFEDESRRSILIKKANTLSYLLIAIVCGLPLIIGAANPAFSTDRETATFGQSTALDLKNDRPIKLAEANICPKDNPSQFIHAETKNFNVYICGGDLPHVYVGIAKNNGSKIVLPLQESQNSQKFIAVKSDSNNRYTYILDRKGLTVLRNGNPIVKEVARWV